MAMDYYSNDKEFNFDTARIVYFYIRGYTVFKEQGFCLEPSLDVTCRENGELPEFIVSPKKDFVDLFDKENVSIKIICGTNGVGKTTLLRLMSGKIRPSSRISDYCIFLYMDDNGNFACTEECTVRCGESGEEKRLDKVLHDAFFKSFCVDFGNIANSNYDMQKHIVREYKAHKNLYDRFTGDERPLITHFKVECVPRGENSISENVGMLMERFFHPTDAISGEWFESDKTAYCFTMLYQNYSDYEESIPYEEYYNRICKRADVSPYVQRCKDLEKELFGVEYTLDQIEEAERKLDSFLSSTIDFEKAAFKSLGKYNGMPSDFGRSASEPLFYMAGFSMTEEMPDRYMAHLSDGERLSIQYAYNIKLSMIQDKGIWWYVDEPGAYLHPEWQRRFLTDYLNAYRETKEYLIEIEKRPIPRGKHFTLIFATHSPFLLSDVTDDYVIYLKKGVDGYASEVNGLKNTFAGNIGEMYGENFFMESTIGEGAKTRLEEMIRRLDCGETLPDGELNGYKRLVSCIGDDLLRKLLEERLEDYETNHHKQ